ncbi:efflux RND transporter periplasmic adaptor subunit [Aureivirga sp. CE67]|uniref:efflux RND transporter periplasmic adaptor subunit n=1 Tax=Aureivirga sp. CE67 TaxID=1788983 RepID=UPI0018CBC7C4|nr:efflux RND transporter periplasmic adaptor subunit [Aureivirga sp. CE67]
MRRKIIIGIILIAFIAVLVMFARNNSKSPTVYSTEKPFYTNIVKKTVATGSIIPLEKIEIKPQIPGIIEKIHAEEGQIVKRGDLIATVRVVPNISNLNSANGSVKNARIEFQNQQILYNRNKNLYEKGVISKQDFESAELSYNTAKQALVNAESNLEVIKRGYSNDLKRLANTNITAQISGTILTIPVKVGNQVIESNSFNAGTTIATIADLNKMIFEGKVDESEVGALKDGTKLEVSIGAIPNKKFPAELNFIAPQGSKEGGAVQFIIKANMTLDNKNFIRAGYSANADIILAKRDSVLAIKEAVLLFDNKTDQPYVEVETGNQEFTRKDVKLGLSDGINVEILSGLTPDDKIKIWNKVSNGKDEKGKYGKPEKDRESEKSKQEREGQTEQQTEEGSTSSEPADQPTDGGSDSGSGSDGSGSGDGGSSGGSDGGGSGS